MKPGPIQIAADVLAIPDFQSRLYPDRTDGRLTAPEHRLSGDY